MTNGDKIRKKTDEELQSLFNKISNACFLCRDGGSVECPFGAFDTGKKKVLNGKEYRVVAPWCVDPNNTYTGAKPFTEWLKQESDTE